MYTYEIVHSSEILEDVDVISTVKRFESQSPDPFVIATIIASLPSDEQWQYMVTEYFTGDNGDWHKNNWQMVDNSVSADEWLEDFLKLEDLQENDLPTVGSKVILPANVKIPKHQKRFCIITKVYFEENRQYLTLRGITSKGISKSDQQVVYCPFSWIPHLEVVNK